MYVGWMVWWAWMPDISAAQQAPRPHHSSSAEKPGHKYNNVRQMQVLKYYNWIQIQMQVQTRTLVKRDIKKQTKYEKESNHKHKQRGAPKCRLRKKL